MPPLEDTIARTAAEVGEMFKKSTNKKVILHTFGYQDYLKITSLFCITQKSCLFFV